jgi:hypothetical protein
MFDTLRAAWTLAREVAENPPANPAAFKAELSRRLANRTLDARTRLFPDYGLRYPSELLSASFDPFNLAVRSLRSSDIAAECALIFAKNFDELKKLANGKLATFKDEEERIDYVLRITNEFHELRHYHDHFGTTYGFSRISNTIVDAMEFNRLWDVLRAKGRIKLPLLKWAKAADGPPELRAYLEKRRDYIEWFKLYDGTIEQDITLDMNQGQAVDDNTAESIIVISVRGLGTNIPAAIINFKNANTGRVFQKVIPLGGALLMEGSAFVTQRILASWFFGPRYHDLIKTHPTVSRGPIGETRWRLYMAGDLYLTKYLHKFYEKFQLALADLAMMNLTEGKEDIHDIHPAWRFSLATKSAQLSPAIHQKADADLLSYMDGIARKHEWMTVVEVAKLADKRAAETIAKLDKSPDAKTFWPSVLRAALNLHREWMKIRISIPTALAEPIKYIAGLEYFPDPPVHQGSTGLVFRGVTQDDASAFRQWFMFEHFQRQLLFSSRLPCPATQVHPHKCPGDPFRKWHWAPTDQCSFAHVVDALGARNVKVEAA